jgi:hypothetical protein
MKLSLSAEPDNLAVIFNIVAGSSTTALSGFAPANDEVIKQLQSILLAQCVVIQATQSFVRQNQSCDIALQRKIKLSLVKIVAKELEDIYSSAKPLAAILSRQLKPTALVCNESIVPLMNILSAFPQLSEKQVRALVCPLFDWFESAVRECIRYIKKTEDFVEPIQGDFFLLNANKAEKRKARKAKAIPTNSADTIV